MSKVIKTSITCNNIAPLEHLQYEIMSSSLKFAIFANNGSGKTFISRLFRLFENDDTLLVDDTGKILTDAYLTYGQNQGNFAFKITETKDNTTIVKENIDIKINAGIKCIHPASNYIFHTFNQDYVDKNIKELDYIKDADDESMQGFILGKAHIDVSDDKKKLEELKQSGKKKQEEIITFIDDYTAKQLSHIANITRLNEYKTLSAASILKWDGKQLHPLKKSVEEYIKDYDKIKSIPENLSLISGVSIPNIDDNIIKINIIKEVLSKAYTLSNFKEDFKSKIKEKQSFVEEGLKLSSKDNVCPFCERPYDDEALALIDLYTNYLNDQEATTIKQLDIYYKHLSDLIALLKELDKDSDKQIRFYNDYKTKYIVSLENETLAEFKITDAISCIQQLQTLLQEKKKNISIPHIVQDDLLIHLKKELNTIVEVISQNNEKIKIINGKIAKISEENKSVRINICKAAYNHLCLTQQKKIEEIRVLAEDSKKLEEEISKKENAMRAQKKKEVAHTIKQVLNFFFDGNKYTLDEDTFQLMFKTRILDKGNIKYAISEGEKNIIAFAYYLGDTHIKINRDDDYKKLFFVIDDPISSLDFTYVYTMSGIIRKIQTIFPKLERPRYIILTHNNEFMRILCANKIVDKKLLLQNGSLSEFNTNFTVPYISHLLDVYRVARKGQTYSHTTANSIRHIIETLVKFQNIELSDDGIDKYIQDHFEKDAKTYTFINDLSHGGWRSEDAPLLPKDYQDVCESIISHINELYPNQIAYCAKCA